MITNRCDGGRNGDGGEGGATSKGLITNRCDGGRKGDGGEGGAASKGALRYRRHIQRQLRMPIDNLYEVLAHAHELDFAFHSIPDADHTPLEVQEEVRKGCGHGRTPASLPRV